MKILENNKLKIIGIAIILGLLASLVTVLTVIFGMRRQSQEPITSLIAPVSAEDEYLDPNTLASILGKDKNTVSILLLGYGGPGHPGPYLADVIQLLHINVDTKKVNLISIPRDLWVSLPNGTQGKINIALTLGNDRTKLVESGAQVAKNMASTVTGLEVDYYIAMNFVGFKRAIGEVLEGIEVEVSETLDDRWYPIFGEELNPCGKSAEEIATLTAQFSGFALEQKFPCRYERIYFPPGKHKMHGHEALAYARSRHGSSGGDFSRSKRQHEILIGARNKALSLEGVKAIPKLFSDLAQHGSTDISLEIITQLAPLLKQGNDFQVETAIISTENLLTSGKSSTGQSILMPRAGQNNWQEIHRFVEQELN